MSNKMKYYVDKDNNVFALKEGEDEFIKDGWKDIEEREALFIANPPLSEKELNSKISSSNTSFLFHEINRVEVKLIQLYRLRDRNKASDIHLSQIEELEDYSTDLMLVESQKGFPLKAKFPLCPEFFKEVSNG